MTRSRRIFKTWIYERKFFKCQKICIANEQLCDVTFNRFDNLKRHIKNQHHNINIIFVFSMLDVKSQRIRHKVFIKSSSTHVQKVRKRSFLSKLYVQNARSRTSSYDSHVSITVQQCLSILEISVTTLTAEREFIVTKIFTSRTSSDFLSINLDVEILFTLSIYEMKQFVKMLQQRDFSWFSTLAKENHDQKREHKLIQWKMTSEHKSICVFCSDDWKHFDFLNLMTLCFKDNYSFQTATRAWYSYLNHETSFARATAWFDVKWSRSNVKFDNFMNYESYKSMNVFHLCHQNHCLIHVIYESVHINQDRKRCHRLTQFFRQQKKEISEHCTKHEFFCKMQIRILDFFSKTFC